MLDTAQGIWPADYQDLALRCERSVSDSSSAADGNDVTAFENNKHTVAFCVRIHGAELSAGHCKRIVLKNCQSSLS